MEIYESNKNLKLNSKISSFIKIEIEKKRSNSPEKKLYKAKSLYTEAYNIPHTVLTAPYFIHHNKINQTNYPKELKKQNSKTNSFAINSDTRIQLNLCKYLSLYIEKNRKNNSPYLLNRIPIKPLSGSMRKQRNILLHKSRNVYDIGIKKNFMNTKTRRVQSYIIRTCNKLTNYYNKSSLHFY